MVQLIYIIDAFIGEKLGALGPVRRVYAKIRDHTKRFIMIRLPENNIVMLFPPGATALALSIASGSYEELTRRVFTNLLKHGDKVLDLGASFGYYTLLASKIVGSYGRVYAFEPCPLKFYILKSNIRLNKLHNVDVFNVAVSDKQEYRDFYLMGEESSFYGNGKKIKVMTVKLDDLLKETRINLVKMDIEGAEMLALKGMENLITINKNLKLIIEYNPRTLARAGFTPLEMIKELRYLGFSRIYIIDEYRSEIVKADLRKLLTLNYTVNLFCYKDS